ncbi:hypothetical protein RUM44_000014 [Polyplax serrata]|uniref:Rab-GAP TBC domain-containing protein n=1 Tax=Polyplax serrata TaxID=468196 RepID=A0ABR1B4Q8_POLSC
MSFINSIKKLTSGSKASGENTKMKFSLSPGVETGFSQWLDAMKMVVQLPGGMPAEFRMKLWLQLSEKHLNDHNIDWEKAEAIIFNEWTNPDDEELGVQIVKDLHRTGCSLFCGEQEHNQALLKRVLLAYARWNKNVGYCQGFNMLAALILQVMNKEEKNAVKVMIYLIEGVLPESYFANNLRGLSVDMAVFRDLLRLRLPKLSKHLEALQHDPTSGTNYEPPLTNVFTMQWFLTLFSNCLPQQTVLRVWDLVFLYGNEVLLRTALAIWGILQDRVITAGSADEFYSIMGVVTREMLEFGLMDANNLIKMIAMVDPFTTELQDLRDKYLYNISPWSQSVQCAARRGIKLFYGEPDDQDETEDEDKIALTTAYGVFRSKRELSNKELQISGPTLDIGILKQQYAKLRQRQRQAHVIITAACNSSLSGGISAGPSVSVNHLLLGKSALVNKGRRIGPPEGSIPPFSNKTVTARDSDTRNVVVSGISLPESRGKGKKVNDVTERRVREAKTKTTEDFFALEITEQKKIPPDIDEDYDDDDDDDDDDGDGDGGSIRKHWDESDSSSTELCDDENGSDFEETSPVGSESYTNETEPMHRNAVHKVIDECKSLEVHESSRCKQASVSSLGEDSIVGIFGKVSGRIPTPESVEKPEKWNGNETGTEITMTPLTYDNTNNSISNSVEFEKFPRFNDAVRLEPEVPINGSLKGEGTDRKKKTSLGMTVIKENSQMLNKYSKRTLERKSVGSPIEKNDVPKEGNNSHETIRMENDEKTESLEHFYLFKDSNLTKTITRMTSKETCRVTCEKVNKEVNTEITFGGKNELEMSSTKTVKEIIRSPSVSVTETLSECRANFRPCTFPQATTRDEVEAKIEISKSDWELKMKKIAELDTSTREALNEMKTQWKRERKSFHRSLDRNTRRCCLDDEGFPTVLPNDETDECRKKLHNTSLSFDAITSRTEQLLGNPVEYNRSSNEPFYFSREFEYRKPRERQGTRNEDSGVSSGESLDRSRKSSAPKEGRSPGDDRRTELRERSTARTCRVQLQTNTDVRTDATLNPFNPFPKRSQSRSKQLGMKLGLYPSSPEDQPKKS